MNITEEYIPRDGEFDPLASDVPKFGETVQASVARKTQSSLISFYSPCELKSYEAPPDECLVGDNHLTRGAMSLLGGAPSVGKSRATLSLAILGARGHGQWFGRPIRCRFKTLIIQDENGLGRLSDDLRRVDDVQELDPYISISGQSLFGLALRNADFRAEIKNKLKTFEPDLVVIDPWTNCTTDSTEKEYSEALARWREILSDADRFPSWLVVHHLRKPKTDDRHRGKSVAYLLSGSDTLHRAARSIFVLQSASDDVEDDRVVCTVCKNSNGQYGPRSAWRRAACSFEAVPDFDFEEFDGDNRKRSPAVKETHLNIVFDYGKRWLPRKEAAQELEGLAGVKRSAAYLALQESGRFAHMLISESDGKLISIRKETTREEAQG